MREIKKHVGYYIEHRSAWKDQSELRPRNVVLFFNYNRNRLCVNTGLKVALCNWNEKKQRIKLTVRRANEVNNYLELLAQKINDIFFTALANGIIPDNNYILKLMKNKPEKQSSLLEHWERYLEVKKVNMPPKSHEAISISYHHFKKFAKDKHINFNDINEELLSQYADYLYGIPHSDNTVHKHIKRLRTFMTYAKKNGFHNNERFKDFNVAAKVGRINFLEWDEVKALLDYTPENETERKALANFLWGSLTAMRFSDYHKLKKSAIVPVNIMDYQAANFRQQKTTKLTSVPMLPEAIAILEQNRNSKDDYALPRMSSQKINDNIKLIAKKVGITAKVPVDTYRRGELETKEFEKWQILGTHFGRKTFITAAASKGIPINIVASIAGQNPKTTMKHYMGVLDKAKFEEVMKKMKF